MYSSFQAMGKLTKKTVATENVAIYIYKISPTAVILTLECLEDVNLSALVPDVNIKALYSMKFFMLWGESMSRADQTGTNMSTLT